jgi:hypothetical protein
MNKMDELNELEIAELQDRQNELWNMIEAYDIGELNLTEQELDNIYDEIDLIDEKIKLLW